MLLQDVFLKQIEELMKEYETLSEISLGESKTAENLKNVRKLLTRSSALAERVVGKNSDYYKHIDEVIQDHVRYDWDIDKLRPIMGSVEALYEDLKAGSLKSFSELIHADVFSDYLEMAEHLLNEGYKEPAAVISGSTLEEHLRKLCIKNSIDIEMNNKKGIKPKKADTMNADLARDDIVYSKLEQKSITAWLDLRNNAAHGKYAKYDEKDVDLLIQGIRNFIIKYPA